MAIHSSIAAWRIPRTEEPGGLYSPQGYKESDTTEVTQYAYTFYPVRCYDWYERVCDKKIKMEPVLLREQWSQEATKKVELEHISAWMEPDI